jgi:hypothetical protein
MPRAGEPRHMRALEQVDAFLAGELVNDHGREYNCSEIHG